MSKLFIITRKEAKKFTKYNALEFEHISKLKRPHPYHVEICESRDRIKNQYTSRSKKLKKLF